MAAPDGRTARIVEPGDLERVLVDERAGLYAGEISDERSD
jgi:hypothetical protein